METYEFSQCAELLWSNIDPENAVKGFTKAGIVPLNPDSYTALDLLAAKSFPWDDHNIQSFGQDLLNSISEPTNTTPSEKYLFNHLIDKLVEVSNSSTSTTSTSMSELKINIFYTFTNK
jgi:hypothetical protein